MINPKLIKTTTENYKPVLSVLVDDSYSIKYLKQQELQQKILNSFKANTTLKDKFDIQYFKFSEAISVADSIGFNGKQTNIYNALSRVKSIQNTHKSPIILISDGNQTIGNDYSYINIKNPVYPVIIGDTTKFEDIAITQLNVNKYSYVGNNFPVEVSVLYNGNKTIDAQLGIYKKGVKVFSKALKLSPNNKSTTININLTATSKGVHYYNVVVSKLPNEKNTVNNSKSFSLEVLDEQVKVLVLSNVLHPDLGALKKAIESNQQRKVTIAKPTAFKENIDNYQFVIFYQPDRTFANYLSKRDSNYLIVTGKNTDWNYVNRLSLGFTKSYTEQTEDYNAAYNANFLTFLQKDIGFDDFPPLKDVFGAMNLEEHQALLYQKVGVIETETPMLAFFEKGENKYATLFGEGIWKWRAANFRQQNSFEYFDAFVGNIVQYLSSNEKRNRLNVSVKNLYLANEIINFSALFLDSNYKFDNRASLTVKVTNTTTNTVKEYPFSLADNSYQVNLENLESGEYKYTVSVNGQSFKKTGKFKVLDYNIEEQFNSANYDKLNQLVLKTNGKLFFSNQQEELINGLINDKQYKITQKLITKEENLINWKWLLFLIAGLLAIEWFLRKYLGKI